MEGSIEELDGKKIILEFRPEQTHAISEYPASPNISGLLIVDKRGASAVFRDPRNGEVLTIRLSPDEVISEFRAPRNGFFPAIQTHLTLSELFQHHGSSHPPSPSHIANSRDGNTPS
jgi:hypothetical protein